MTALITTNKLISGLASYPEQVEKLFNSLSAEAATLAPEPGEWSARQILEHVASFQILWFEMAKHMYLHGEIEVNQPHWIDIHTTNHFSEIGLEDLLDRFAKERKTLVAFIAGLTEEQFNLGYPFNLKNGKPDSRSINQVFQRLARHEKVHMKQFLKTINSVNEHLAKKTKI